MKQSVKRVITPPILDLEASTSVPLIPLRDAVYFPGTQNSLLVARDASITALRKALDSEGALVLVRQRDMEVDDPKAKDIEGIGVLSLVHIAMPMPDGGFRATLRCLNRAEVFNVKKQHGMLWGDIRLIEEAECNHSEASALVRACRKTLRDLRELDPTVSEESLREIAAIDNPGEVADRIGHTLPFSQGDLHEMLTTLDPVARLKLALVLIRKEIDIQKWRTTIEEAVESKLGATHREYVLREQLDAIRTELGEKTEAEVLSKELFERLHSIPRPAPVVEKVTQEIHRLEWNSGASAEFASIRDYIETALSTPWQESPKSPLLLNEAKKRLDNSHIGLGSAKNRILELVAARILGGETESTILCLVGPPGVGKTSFARATAAALDLPFAPIALGGLRDDAAIRGHRRAYVGARPGRLAQALINCKANDPVILLDEIDKMTVEGRAASAAALLEALDSHQNRSFVDRYLEFGIDLSKVLFIATANSIEDIPAALFDRLEIVDFSAYSMTEKLDIAAGKLLEEARRQAGLRKDQFDLTRDELTKIIDFHTSEAGVRGLTRAILSLARAVSIMVVEGQPVPGQWTDEMLSRALGQERAMPKLFENRAEVGRAWALVVNELGGAVIPFEVALNSASSSEPGLTLTGNLGDVLKESASLAFTYLRSRMPQSMTDHHAHLHAPLGAIRKDGPSGGLAILVALLSAYSGRPVDPKMAFTGELSLSGRVLPVGGLKEKMLAAQRCGIETIVYPAELAVPELPGFNCRLVPVSRVEEALAIAGLGDGESSKAWR